MRPSKKYDDMSICLETVNMDSWMFVCLVFNGTLSTNTLYHATGVGNYIM